MYSPLGGRRARRGAARFRRREGAAGGGHGGGRSEKLGEAQAGRGKTRLRAECRGQRAADADGGRVHWATGCSDGAVKE